MSGKTAKRLFLYLVFIVIFVLTVAVSAIGAPKLSIVGKSIILDGRRGQILYSDSGDLNGDGIAETVFAMLPQDSPFTLIVVSNNVHGKFKLLTTHESGYYSLKADVTDVNGDGRDEIVARGISGDGHWWCEIFKLQGNKLASLGWFFNTRLRDLTGDGIPELLSLNPIGAMSLGDHWLIIYKWNGHGYTDVSRRFPCMYDAVIKDLRKTLFQRQYTNTFGSRYSPSEDPGGFADIYFYLGQAYEYRGLIDKAREQYAIAYRLNSEDDGIKEAFKRTWKLD